MAYLAQCIFMSLLITCTTLSHAQTSSLKPKALVLPVTKDASTRQFITHINIGNPPVKKNFVVDLGGRHLWMYCSDNYESSTYKPGYCGSAACSVAKADCIGQCLAPPMPGCHNNTCRVFAQNPIRPTVERSEIAIDTISMQSTDGSKPLSNVSIPNFIFACAPFWPLMLGLADGVNGMLGLSKDQVALPTQISSSFGAGFRKKFAICLPSNTTSNGVLFLGDSPYVFYLSYNPSLAVDASYRLKYTQLYVNYERTGSPTIQGAELPEYFVKVTSILVNKKPIPINSTLLDFHRTGIGGSKITTAQSYTVLESSIYKALVKAFDEELSMWNVNISKVNPVDPFSNCYTKGNLRMSRLGLSVPVITLIFENNDDVSWDIYGANSMVEISDDVVCLGFLDGFPPFSTSIDIGSHQLQDNLLQFDLGANRMAFTSTLLLEEIECSNFKF